MKIKKHKVGELGTLDIEIPVISVGEGRPKISIVCGIHGNERTGLFIVDRLLKQIKLKKGQINIITSANQLAQVLDRRENQIDNKDLNRIFPGNKDGELTDRIANKLIELVKDSDLVIDLHTMERQSIPIMGILMGNTDIEKRSMQFLRIFDPGVVWRVAVQRRDEAEFRGAFGIVLAKMDVVNFALEFSGIARATESELEEAVNGFKRILASLEMIDEEFFVNNPLVFQKKMFQSDKSGLFIPMKKVMEKVRKDELIGKIISLKDFSEISIKSPEEGILMQIRIKDFVNTADDLFAIGTKPTSS